jgi:hypothetical protein
VTPCASRLGGPYPTSRPLTLSVAIRVLPRGSFLALAPLHRAFARRSGIPHRQDPVTARPVKIVWLVSPERLRPARFSTLRSSEADCGPCYVRAIRLAPFRPARSVDRLSPTGQGAPSVTRTPPNRATHRLLGLPLGSPREVVGRCFSPISATNQRHVHPTVRSISGHRGLRHRRSRSPSPT